MVKSFFIKLLLLCLIAQRAFAQVSFVEGLSPLEGISSAEVNALTTESRKSLGIKGKCQPCTIAIANFRTGHVRTPAKTKAKSPSNRYSMELMLTGVSIGKLLLG